jgi:WD40 repeat protein
LVAKISDFGLAKLLDSDADLTRTNEVVGTPHYMAPEQAQGHRSKIGPTTDIHALGVILYELLTGRPPFQGVMPLDIQLRVIYDEPLPPRRLQPTLSRDLDTICLKCLEKDPRRRYATAAALAEDLARFLAGQPIMVRPVSRWERLWKWTRRQPVVATLLAVVALVTLLGVAGITWKWWDAAAGWAQADDQRRQAEAAEARARAEAGAEAVARRDAVAQRERTEWALYGSRLSNALSAWNDNEPRITRELLKVCPERFRHWEYAYLRRLADSNQSIWNPSLASGAIDSLAVAPDGRHVVVAQPGGNLQVIAADTGKPLMLLRTGRQGPCRVCFRPDSRCFASVQRFDAGTEGQLCVWDVTDGRKLLTVAVRVGAAHVRFSPDGRRLVYGGPEDVQVLDAATGQSLLALRGLPPGGAYVGYSSNGQYIAGARGPAAKVWDATTGQLVHTLEGHSQPIIGLSFSADNRHLATCSMDRIIRIWDQTTGQLRQVLQGHNHFVLTLDFSPDGKRLVSGSWDRTVRLWDVDTGQPLRTLRGPMGHVPAVAFFPDGQRVISGDQFGMLTLWEAGQDQEYRSLPFFIGGVRCASLSPDVSRVAAINFYENQLWVADSRTGQKIWSEGIPKVRAVQYSPHGRWLMALVIGQPLQRRDASTGQLLHTYEGDPSGVLAFALDRTGRRIASIGGDQMLKVRDALSGRLLIGGEKLPDDFRTGPLCFSSDGQRLFLGSNRGRLQVRDADSGALRQTFTGHPAAIHCLAASADGRYLASGSDDQSVKLWDAATGQEKATLRGHPARLMSVAFTPDGERLVSGCYERALKLWCTANGQELLPLPGHFGGITSLEFNADGRWLMSSSEDGTVRLWDAGEQWQRSAAGR